MCDLVQGHMVHSENIQTPSPVAHFVTLQPYSKIRHNDKEKTGF
jgi:hypothetical protein